MTSGDGDPFEGVSGGSDDGERGHDWPMTPGGWVPPEERAWRHPSETGNSANARREFGPGIRPGSRGPRALWTTALVGAGAVAALVSGVLMLVNRDHGPQLASPPAVSSPPNASTHSVVRLDVSRAGPSMYGCGVAVAADGLVATNATLLTGASRITVTTASGRRLAGSVVAVDPTSDVGLIRVPARLPVARFVDWSDVQPGAGAIELAVATRPTSRSWALWLDETIASIGEPVGSGPGSGMVSVVASTPSEANPNGAVLMEPDGEIVGLFDRLGVSADGGAVFLPGMFVSDVAHELISHGGQIEHGWLGIQGSDFSGSPEGALVTTVEAAGPANGLLTAGDVITAIDGRRVRSMADLRSRLYLLAPGSAVTLTVRRAGTDRRVALVLSQAA